MQVKVNSKVKAIFRKYGKHELIGIVNEVRDDAVSIKVIGGDMKDMYINFMAKNKFNVLISPRDVKEIIGE